MVREARHRDRAHSGADACGLGYRAWRQVRLMRRSRRRLLRVEYYPVTTYWLAVTATAVLAVREYAGPVWGLVRRWWG